MNEKGDLALVPRPPDALERPEPGAERVLSGIVADTLALIKSKQANKLVVSVAMCGYWGMDFLPDVIREFFKQELEARLSAELNCFAWVTDLLNAARQSRFDLFILILNPNIYSRKNNTGTPLGQKPNWEDHGDEVEAYELIANLKQEFKKPVLVISNGITYSSNTELEKAGANAVIGMPFTLHECRRALQKCPGMPIPLRIVILDDEEGYRDMYAFLIKSWYDGVEILTFGDGGNAWQELSRADPDLFISDLNHTGTSCREMLGNLAKRKSDCAILIISGMTGYADIVKGWGPGLNVWFLQKPIDTETFRPAVEAALQISARHAP